MTKVKRASEYNKQKLSRAKQGWHGSISNKCRVTGLPAGLYAFILISKQQWHRFKRAIHDDNLILWPSSRKDLVKFKTVSIQTKNLFWWNASTSSSRVSEHLLNLHLSSLELLKWYGKLTAFVNLLKRAKILPKSLCYVLSK